MKWIRLCAVLCILLAASPAFADWVFETIADLGDQGRFASLAIDSTDTPHAAWYDATTGSLMYGLRYFDGWDVEQVDTGNKGKYTSIAINPVTDLPAIAYTDQGNQKARYAWYDGATWHKETIVWDDDEDEGRYIDLTFTSGGTPYIAYHYNNGAFQTVGVNVVWKSGGIWYGRRLDSFTFGFGEIGIDNAIAVDALDYPQIAYRDGTVGAQNQRFGWQDGTGWHDESAITLDVSGDHADIALDNGDNVYIVYYDYDSDLFSPTDCTSLLFKDVNGWHSKDEIDCGDRDFGWFPSIAMDSTYTPHVVYLGDDELMYGVETGKGWNLEQVVNGNVQADNAYTGIVLDSVDNPMLLYYCANVKDMCFAWQMPGPEVLTIDPDNGLNTGPVTDVVITGQTFTPSSTAALYQASSGTTINATSLVVDSGTQLTCDFDITGAPIGLYDVQVTNETGTGELQDGFTVNTVGPELTSIDPTTGKNDDTSLIMTLTGDYFTDALDVFLFMEGESDEYAVSVDVLGPTEADAEFNLLDLATGVWDVVVETEYGTDVLEDAFTITCGDPIADFSGTPRVGMEDLLVQFSDASTTYNTCDISAWAWTFGDANTADVAAPQNLYVDSGLYSVSLTVTTPAGTDTETKFSYILVTELVCDDCNIENKCWEDGQVNPDNNCLKCDVGSSTTQWSDNDGVSCDDGVFCNGQDSCDGGACSQHVGDPCPENEDLCDGVTSCNEDTDACETTEALDCEDDNACTTDSCDPAAGCVNEVIDCDDENICTFDSCDTDLGCQYTFNHQPCDDEDKCTVDDVCDQGVCGGTDKDCDDENVCTEDACNGGTGECEYVNNTSPCDDEDACTENDVCSEAVCAGAAKNCDDANGCTDDSCDADTGECAYVDNANACDDGLYCNGQDTCSAGDCSVHSGNPCPEDDGLFCNGEETIICDEQIDACEHSGDPCDTEFEDCNEESDECDDKDEDLWPEGKVSGGGDSGGCCG